ncbi:Ste11p [Rhizophagus irregularis DAOM 197198w]|uniref:Ste11p n=1 Tax=Rhizophagus irregularis (strain DAOM 197198w) TaxID=1432141 RepID=A0A015JH03_RHIIW|nr:Ste11p [Rhizophagus irregularis DAOM 197198w]
MVDICFYCNCLTCICKLLQPDWTSGNKYIDKFIKEAQLKVNVNLDEIIIEWIPFNGLRNIKYLAHGGFSTIYKAIWLDGYISSVARYRNLLNCEDHKIAKEKDVKSPLNKNEKKGVHVALKSLKNSSNISDDFINELKNHLQCMNSNVSSAVRIFGITQDPETSNYMIVMELINGGNLRSNLLIKKYNPFEKYYNLACIAYVLLKLHRCNIIHGDFHSGNILIHYSYSPCYISDFGLSRPVNQTINSNEIYGVIPYMAPEVLRGKSYTKAADIYSFGIIMWEFTSGIPAFSNRPHDFNLSLDICKGLRPEIVKSTLPVYASLMKRCWDSNPNKRPTAEELHQITAFWCDYFPKCYENKRNKIPSNEQITKNHPLSCYTSRKIDYSAKINEILSQEELSNKIVIDEEKEIINDITSLSKNLENFRIPDLKKILKEENFRIPDLKKILKE